MDTRKFDLLELMEMRRKAPNAYWRDRYDQIIDKIAREGDQVRSERENLLKAVRGSDNRSVKFYQEKISRIVQNKTYGHDIS